MIHIHFLWRTHLWTQIRLRTGVKGEGGQKTAEVIYASLLKIRLPYWQWQHMKKMPLHSTPEPLRTGKKLANDNGGNAV